MEAVGIILGFSFILIAIILSSIALAYSSTTAVSGGGGLIQRFQVALNYPFDLSEIVIWDPSFTTIPEVKINQDSNAALPYSVVNTTKESTTVSITNDITTFALNETFPTMTKFGGKFWAALQTSSPDIAIYNSDNLKSKLTNKNSINTARVRPFILSTDDSMFIVSRDVTTGVYVNSYDPVDNTWTQTGSLTLGANIQALTAGVIGGLPAIIYTLSGATTDIKFRLSNDLSGSSWAAERSVTTNAAAVTNMSLIELSSGEPAIVFMGNGQTLGLDFIKSIDSAGVTWDPVVNLPGVINTTNFDVKVLSDNRILTSGWVLHPGNVYSWLSDDTTGDAWTAGSSPLEVLSEDLGTVALIVDGENVFLVAGGGPIYIYKAGADLLSWTDETLLSNSDISGRVFSATNEGLSYIVFGTSANISRALPFGDISNLLSASP